MYAAIEDIEYLLPERTETSEELAQQFPGWSLDKIAERTGVHMRRIAADDECASDLAVAACERLLSRRRECAEDFDFLLFCTQTPDYFLPTTACLVQERLGLPTSAGALDINLGCSGYVYALGLAKGLIETGQARRVLLITADTYSKFIHPGDKSVRALFGDAAAATIVSNAAERTAIGPFVYGTDGRGADDLIVPMGGMREPFGDRAPEEYADRFGNRRSPRHVRMNGKAIVDFSLREVPRCVETLCERAGVHLEELDAVVPHQASAKVLNGLRRALGLSPEKFWVYMDDIGNTVSCSIPIALARAREQGRLRDGMRLMLVGFGVGLSWGATLATWRPSQEGD